MKKIFLLICVFFFLSIYLLISTNLVLAKTVTVVFDENPSLVSVQKAPLKYNKDFAFSFGYDDTYTSAYDKAFKYLNGGYVEVDDSYYPGLYFTDGTGNDIPFRGSYSWFSVNSSLNDFHIGSEAYISWEELDESYEAGWDVLHHGWSPANDSASTTAEIVNGIAWVASSTSNNIQLQHFVVPGGISDEDETAMIEAGFANGIKSVMKNGTTFHFNGNDYLASSGPTVVNSLDLDNYYMSRDYYYDDLYGNATSTMIANIDNLSNNSGPGNNLWRVAFTHRVRNLDEGPLGGNFSWDQWKYLMDYIEANYGKSGDDSAWVAGPQEVFEYISVKNDSVVSTSLTDNILTINIDDSAVDNDLRRKSLSLLVSDTEASIDYITYSDGDFSYTTHSTSTGLINLDWEAVYNNNLSTQVETYVSAAENSQSESDIDIAQIWVDFMEAGQSKNAFQQRLDQISVLGRNWKLDFGYNSNNLGAWNEVNVGTTAGSTISNLHDGNNNITDLGFRIIREGFSKSSTMGESSGNGSGLYPDIRMQYGLRTYGDLEESVGDPELIMLFTGATVGKTYDFKIFGSTTKTDNDDGTTSVYTIGNESVELQNSLNTSNYVTIDNVSPNNDGEIQFSMHSKDTANWKFSFLNVLEINEVANTAPRLSYNNISQQNSNGRVNIYYKLKDREEDLGSINLYEYSLSGEFNGEESLMTIASADENHNGVSSVITSKDGVNHYFVWDAKTDLGNIATSTVYVRLRPTDGSLSGDIATSTVFSVDFASPSLSNIDNNVASTSAIISWSSNKEANSQVYYGTNNNISSFTDISNTRQYNHEIELDNLSTCSKYYYKLYSNDQYNNIAESPVYTFNSSRCLGDANIISQVDFNVLSASSTTQNFNNTSIYIPENSFSGSNAVLQIMKLNYSDVLNYALAPSSYSLVSDLLLELNMFSEENTKIESFNNNIVISMSYEDEDILGMDENSLDIYYWNNNAWTSLNSCVVNSSDNNISCTTNHFSTFALFGSGDVSATETDNNILNSSLPVSFFSSPKAPEGGFNVWVKDIINNEVELGLSGGSDAKYMAVSLTGNFLEVNLIPYSENYSLIALEDEGYIYVKFYTKYGVPSQIIKTFFDKSKYSKIKNINKNKDQTAVILDEVLDYKFTSFLSLGTNSDEVKKLQERLKTLGYFNYPNITGYFGPITLQAVKSFQLANNIESVGYVGPKTREALNKY